MQKLTCLLVDDIPDILEMLEKDIKRLFPNVEVIGRASSVIEAAKSLRVQEPDILFLDIMLGDGTGFDLLQIYPELTSKVIFVTASDEYAIKAFKFAAIDYVLKPYSDEDLTLAIEKAKSQIQPNSEQLQVLQETLSETVTPKKISLHTQEKIIIVELANIIRCESDNNYTLFYFNDSRKVLVAKTLKTYADMLKESGFIRVHQSHLVNRKYIKEFIRSDGGYLFLEDRTTVPVSVRKRSEVIEALRQF